MIHKIAHEVIRNLYQSYPDHFDEEKKDHMRYGLEIVIGEFIKLIILMTFFAVLGIFKPFLHTLFVFMSLRFWGGGHHFKTFKGCMAATTSYFLIIIMLSNLYSLHNISDSLSYFNTLLLIIIGMVLAPIFSKHQVKTQKMYYLRKALHSFTMILLAIMAFTNVIALEPSILIFSLLGYNLQLFLGGVKNGRQKKFV